MPGCCEKLQKILVKNISFIQPRFIAQGTIIKDQQYPDIVSVDQNELSNITKKLIVI